MKLSPKQEKFIRLISEGKTQIEAYTESYSAKNMSKNAIYVEASKLLNEEKNPKIAQRLKELQKEIADNSKWSVDKLIKKFELIADRCMQEEEIKTFIGGEMVRTGEYKFDSSGAIKALENIGKLCGFYETKLKHSGSVVTKINLVPAADKKGDKHG